MFILHIFYYYFYVAITHFLAIISYFVELTHTFFSYNSIFLGYFSDEGWGKGEKSLIYILYKYFEKILWK